MTPAPQSNVTFSAGVEALKRIEAQRQAREDRMRNALEILADSHWSKQPNEHLYSRFVRATAREGLGRE